MNQKLKKICNASLALLILTGIGISTSKSNAHASRHSLPSKFYGHWYGTSYQYKNGKKMHRIYPISIYYGKYGGYIISYNKHKSYNNAYDAYTGRLHEAHWTGNAYHDYEGKKGTHMLSNLNFLPKPYNHILDYNNGARNWNLHKVSNRRVPARKQYRKHYKKRPNHKIGILMHFRLKNKVYVTRINRNKVVPHTIRYVSSLHRYNKKYGKALKMKKLILERSIAAYKENPNAKTLARAQNAHNIYFESYPNPIRN